MYYFDRYLIFVVTSDPYPHGSYEVNPYLPADMIDPTELFFCHEYVYRVLIPGGYVLIVISALASLEEPEPFYISFRKIVCTCFFQIK